MKLFNKLFKKKEEPKKKYTKDSVYGKWEDGLISADDVMLLAACDFYKYALDFVWHIEHMKGTVKKHNEELPFMQNVLNDVLSSENYPGRGTDLALLQSHKNDKREALEIARTRGIAIFSGCCALEKIDSCKEIRDDVKLDWSKESMLKYCSLEGLKEIAIEEKVKASNIGETAENLMKCIPTEDQIGLFYDACELYKRLLQEGYEKKSYFDVNNLFTDSWLMQLPDENHVYHVVEEDYFADYIEMDYKGVV